MASPVVQVDVALTQVPDQTVWQSTAVPTVYGEEVDFATAVHDAVLTQEGLVYWHS